MSRPDRPNTPRPHRRPLLACTSWDGRRCGACLADRGKPVVESDVQLRSHCRVGWRHDRSNGVGHDRVHDPAAVVLVAASVETPLSGTASGGTANSRSPRTRSGTRLVDSTSNLGHRAASRLTSGAAATRCSKLSSSRSIRCPPMWLASSSSLTAPGTERVADVTGDLVSLPNRAQVDIVSTGGELTSDPSRGIGRQPCLPDTALTGNRHGMIGSRKVRSPAARSASPRPARSKRSRRSPAKPSASPSNCTV